MIEVTVGCDIGHYECPLNTAPDSPKLIVNGGLCLLTDSRGG